MKISFFKRFETLATGGMLVALLAACARETGARARSPSASPESASAAPAKKVRSRSLERVSIGRELSLELPLGRKFALAPPRGAFGCARNEELAIEVCSRIARVPKSEKLEDCERGMERSLRVLRDASERAVESRLDRPRGYFGRSSLRVGKSGERLVTHFALDAGVCIGVVAFVSLGDEADDLAALVFEGSLPTLERASIDDRVSPVASE